MTYFLGGIFSRTLGGVRYLIRNEIRSQIFCKDLDSKYICLSYNTGFNSFRKFYCTDKMGDKIPTKEELKQILTPLQYHVTQEKGTERPFTGKYDKTTDAGTYVCVVCKEPLFSSNTKFDSGCGWPAFNDVLDKGLVKLSKDTSNGLVRTEVQCSKCDAHLGHVFDDGPLPTRKRFCINSASIHFIPT